MKQRICAGCALIAFVFSLLLLAGCKKVGPEEVVRQFFDQVQQGKFKEAWEKGSFQFQTAQSFSIFESSAKDVGFTRGGKLTWTDRKIGEREATFAGTFEAPERPLVKLRVKVVPESGEWKIADLSITPQGEGENPVMATFKIIGTEARLDDPLSRKMPSEDQIQQLVRDTMMKFNEAIQNQDFGPFHATFARKWQSQITPERVQKAFQSFIDLKVNLAPLESIQPKFIEPPRMAPDGELVVNGYYDTAPIRVVFGFRYVYDLPKWRLYGFNCRLDDLRTQPQTSGTNAAPEPATDANAAGVPAATGTDEGK